VQTTLPGSQVYHRVLRAIGIGTWMFLGLPIFDSSTRRGYPLTRAQWLTWLGFFLLFGPAFWYSSSPRARRLSNRVSALALETLAALGMTFLLQDYFVGFLLVIVSWQVALLLSLSLAIGWMLGGFGAAPVPSDPHYYMGWRWGRAGPSLVSRFSLIVTAALAKSEAESREDQARINAELVSTRELLRESTRLGERIRISREIHDSLGHHLASARIWKLH
jgi:signal transduction histidine kinase